jgi:hypothetical protein
MQRPPRLPQFLAQPHIGRWITVVVVDIAQETGALGESLDVQAAMTRLSLARSFNWAQDDSCPSVTISKRFCCGASEALV